MIHVLMYEIFCIPYTETISSLSQVAADEFAGLASDAGTLAMAMLF